MTELGASPTTRRLKPVGWSTALLALVTVALWGANPVAASYSLDTLPPIAVAAVRFTMASAFLFVWCQVERCGIILSSNQVIPALVAGLGMFVQIVTFNVGLAHSSSSHASMLLNTFVPWVVVLEHFVTRGDRVTWRKVLGVGVAFSGVLLLLAGPGTGFRSQSSQDPPTLFGDLTLLFSGVVLAVKVVYVKHALRAVETGKLIFWQASLAAVLFWVCSALFESLSLRGFTTVAVVSLLYQGVFVAGLCFALQAVLLRHHSASQIAVFSFATPLFGVGLGVLMRGDQLTKGLFVAAACVACGILLVNWPQREVTTETPAIDSP